MTRIDEPRYQAYYAALTQGDRRRCTTMVKELLDGGIELTELYINLYQRSLYEIGAGWENNEISVATEHIATAITQGLLQLSYSRLFSQERNGRSVVMACTPGEYHQIGAMVITDLMELWGWDTRFVGANTPTDDLLDLIEQQRPDVLALSVSIQDHLPAMQQTVARILEAHPQQIVVAGGQGLTGVQHHDLDIRKRVAILASIDELQAFLGGMV